MPIMRTKKDGKGASSNFFIHGGEEEPRPEGCLFLVLRLGVRNDPLLREKKEEDATEDLIVSISHLLVKRLGKLFILEV